MDNNNNNKLKKKKKKKLKNKKYICKIKDFDGTLSLTDTGAKVIDVCFGYENRKAFDKLILDKVRTYTDCVAEMWDSVNLSWEEAKELIKDAEIDPYFNEVSLVTIKKKRKK